MSRTRLYPHRRARPDAVIWYDWWVEREGGRELLSLLLTGWDYAKDITVGISFELDPGAILESTGLASLEDLEVLVLGDCPDTQQRFSATAGLRNYRERLPIDIRLNLPSGQLAGSVQLSAHLVLARTVPPRGDRVAHLRGSRMHSSNPHTVKLEGDAGRFPTESVPFSEVRLGNAPWTVLTVYEDLSTAFMGSVRLLINTEHPVGQLLLATPPDTRMERLIKADIIRLLVASAAGRALETNPESVQEEGSVAQVLETMSRLFLGRSLRSAARLYIEDPAEFDVLLHDRLEPLIGLAT
jgi:hypothetical protein